MGFRAVLFDWGGTLVHERPVDVRGACESAVAALSAAGAPAPSAAALHELLATAPFEARSIAQLLESGLHSLGIHPSPAALAAASGAFAAEATSALECFEDARALLPSLRYRGYAVGVVTNSLFSERVLQAATGRLGIAGYLDVIVTSADCGAAKPDPRPLLLALERLRCPAGDAIFVGDRTETDIAAARAAGVAAVLVDRTGRQVAPPGVTRVAHLAAVNELLGESLRA